MTPRSLTLFLVLASCAGGPEPKPPPPPAAPTPPQPVEPLPAPTIPPPATPDSTMPNFDDDVSFLKRHGEVIVLGGAGAARVAVSPTYQGRVMTSTAGDAGATSLGWIHRSFIASGRTGTQFDNYGGEDRFWLGPEAGQYGLYFPPKSDFVFDKWQTPRAFNEGAWVYTRDASSVTFTREMTVENYAGTEFKLEVTRTVRLLTSSPMSAGSEVKWVGFETRNTIKNVGNKPWTKDKGLLSIWLLGMYNPSPDTWVIVPFDPSAKGPVVNDRYFGKVPAERLVVDEKGGVMFFKCDGKVRTKIGLSPARARAALGSYSDAARLLTVVTFERSPSTSQGASDYVNSMWEKQKEPYRGDVVNSYNDGPTEPGKPSLGGFYEIETSSPAAALAPGQTLTHAQTTLHFVGDRAALDPIATKALGVALQNVPRQ